MLKPLEVASPFFFFFFGKHQLHLLICRQLTGVCNIKVAFEVIPVKESTHKKSTSQQIFHYTIQVVPPAGKLELSGSFLRPSRLLQYGKSLLC